MSQTLAGIEALRVISSFMMDWKVLTFLFLVNLATILLFYIFYILWVWQIKHDKKEVKE